MDRTGLLIILSSPSGAGKSTLARRLIDWDPTLSFSVSATTRAPRPAEVDGQHYHFIAREDFAAMVEAGDMLEHAEVFGNLYGSPRQPVEHAMQAGRDATLAGCRHRKGWLFREARALRGLEGGLWDGRWRVTGAGEVRALGAGGLRQCDGRVTGLPREVLAVTPALWDGDRLLAAPSAGFGASTATISRPFHLFGLSD